jgi:hypothetical protein
LHPTLTQPPATQPHSRNELLSPPRSRTTTHSQALGFHEQHVLRLVCSLVYLDAIVVHAFVPHCSFFAGLATQG